MQKQMDALLDVSEKLKPSLDINDKTTMKESLSNLTNKMAGLSAAAEQRTVKLKDHALKWQEYKVTYSNVSVI